MYVRNNLWAQGNLEEIELEVFLKKLIFFLWKGENNDKGMLYSSDIFLLIEI